MAEENIVQAMTIKEQRKLVAIWDDLAEMDVREFDS